MYVWSLAVSLLGLASSTQICFGLSQSDVDAYIASESAIAKAGVLANIGHDGSKSHGAAPGAVVASPSKENPDYVFTWTRDSSLVFKMLIDQYTNGIDSELRGHIDSFVAAEHILQQTTSRSGGLTTGGLGEPKFNIDLSAFNGNWGRPQRDGPALRATALITYANWLIKNSGSSFVSSTLWPMIKLDLDYVSLNWNLSTFDLWEEIDSSSYFTAAVQHRSLREGISLASKLGEESSITSYPTQADNILCFMQSFWNPGSHPYMSANTNRGHSQFGVNDVLQSVVTSDEPCNPGGPRTSIDVNTLLASIHTFDAEAGCDSATFQPCSDKALVNLLTYVESFRDVYSINSGAKSDAALATGRYAEDCYFKGNPWYLATFAVAEQLYDALQVWNKQNSLEVTELSQPFFAKFNASITPGTYDASSKTFSSLTESIRTYADAYIALAARFTPEDGELAEQYGKDDGKPLSARDLTWSYASAITAFQARDGTNAKFGSWGAKGLEVPDHCGTASGGNGHTVTVTFNVHAETVLGENIYLAGSSDNLARWSPDNALLMSASNYPIWSITVDLPANTIVQYKYIRKHGGSVVWESDPNNQFTTPESGSQKRTDSWQ